MHGRIVGTGRRRSTPLRSGMIQGHVRPAVGAEVVDPGLAVKVGVIPPAKQEHLVPAREAMACNARADGEAAVHSAALRDDTRAIFVQVLALSHRPKYRRKGWRHRTAKQEHLVPAEVGHGMPVSWGRAGGRAMFVQVLALRSYTQVSP